jgi:nucleotide-binding universal stress UspA family protein
VSNHVVAHAHCPVVVLKEPAGGGDVVTAGVVVGIDGSEESQACLGFAFEHAYLSRRPLEAVHAWSFGRARRPSLPGAHEIAAERHRLLSEALAGWGEKYPEVTVTRTVVHADAVPALLDRSAGADLLVVGRRGQGRFPGLALGSVSHNLVHRAPCPVAVVRAADTS